MSLRDSIIAAKVGSSVASSSGTNLLEFRFGPDNPVFAGHFPSRPILPGVFQLEMTRLAVEQTLQRSFAIREIVRAKFTRPIVPNEIIRVELKLSEKNGTIQVRAAFSVGGQMAGDTLCLLCELD